MCGRASVEKGFQVVDVTVDTSTLVRVCDSCYYGIPLTQRNDIRLAVQNAVIKHWQYSHQKAPFHSWFADFVTQFPEREIWNKWERVFVELYAYEEWNERR